MARRPPSTSEPFTDREIVALLAVVTGARMIRDVQRASRWGSTQSAHQALTKLAAAGFVTWEPGRKGTLRPLVARVRFTIPSSSGQDTRPSLSEPGFDSPRDH